MGNSAARLLSGKSGDYHASSAHPRDCRVHHPLPPVHTPLTTNKVPGDRTVWFLRQDPNGKLCQLRSWLPGGEDHSSDA